MSVLEPSKIAVPFGENGLRSPIPSNSDPITGRAGYSQGFPAINMTPKEAGGIPPYGQDFNGILYDITKALRYEQQGGFYTYDNSFATAIGGYTKGSVLIGKISTALFQNQIDGNITDPEGSNAAGWSRFGPNSYGLPMIGELVMWPNVSMPQEIWPDIGAKFIPYIGQAFSKTLYPFLAELHPSGTLPADMRGEFPRGWDNSRGVDVSRALMSSQGDAIRNITGRLTGRRIIDMGGAGALSSENTGLAEHSVATNSALITPQITFDASRVVPTASENRPRNIAWNMIVRAA